MAILASGDEAVDALNNVIRRLENLRDERGAIDRSVQDLIDQGYPADAIATAANAQLTLWGSVRDEIATTLGDVATDLQSVVRIGMPALYNSAVLVAEDVINYGAGTIRVDSAFEGLIDPFAVFQAGDIIKISNAANAWNNGSYQVRGASGGTGTTDHLQNGDFTGAATHWTLSGTGVAYASNHIAFTGGSVGTLSQAKADMATAWTAGKAYLVKFTVGFTGGAVAVGTTTNPAQFSANAAGTHQCVIVADNDAAGLIFTGVIADLTIDLVSMVPFSGLVLTTPLGSDTAKDSKLVITLAER